MVTNFKKLTLLSLLMLMSTGVFGVDFDDTIQLGGLVSQLADVKDKIKKDREHIQRLESETLTPSDRLLSDLKYLEAKKTRILKQIEAFKK